MTPEPPTNASDAPDALEHEYERFPEPRRKGGFGRKLFAALVILAVIGLIGAGLAYVAYQRQVDPAGPPGEALKLTVPMGSSTQRIGQLLEADGVITSASTFRYFIRINGGGPFQAGEYTLNKNMSMGEAIAKLDKGPDLKFERLTIREGLVLPQIAEAVATLEGRSAEAFTAALESGKVKSKFQPAEVMTLEGLLLPETYNLEPKDDEARILERMVSSFDAVAEQAGVNDAKAKVGISPYEALVVASLIERETRFDDERPMVAQVIYNRLKRKMPLGIDASIIYALGKSADKDVRVLFKDLEIDSPYNTYKRVGLPPTPIAAPGRASIEAALNPEPSEFLFYVVTEKSGRHSFAKTGAEHQANIRKAEAAGVR